jgi:hypothetical protein
VTKSDESFGFFMIESLSGDATNEKAGLWFANETSEMNTFC